MSEPWRTRQDATHTALRTIFAAQGYWTDNDNGDAPTAFGPHRPSS
ncbi:hypothetical protein [Streptomyces sp. NPDC091219]